MNLIIKIDSLADVYDRSNAPTTSAFPLVLSADMVRLSSRQFYEVKNEQHEILAHSLRSQQTSAIEDHFKLLHFGMSPIHFAENHLSDYGYSGFDEYWTVIGAKYPYLRQFCDELATGFNGTSTVEAELSTFGRQDAKEKSNNSKLTVEGEMHSQQ